jgi:2-methylcitrate dehydratase PrpD
MLSPDHYARGFHATGTIGTFAAAAGCARLIGLDEEAMRRALGFAATQASGLIAMFGTGAKPLHAGNAAAHGLLAALLAEKGLTARQDALECAQGFAATHGGACNPEAALAKPRYGHHVRENLFKVHAACYGTHATLECAQSIRRARDCDPQSVRSVWIGVGEECARTCDIKAPTTGAEAKFSLRFNAAAALAGLPTGKLSTYSSETCCEPTLIALRDKVEVEFVPGRPLTLAEMRVVFADGSIERSRADTSVPCFDLVRQEAVLARKFTDLTAGILDTHTADALRDRALSIDDVDDVARLMQPLRSELRRPDHVH